ncbi:MAG: di-trans,poly-cis-decaprenylcistransferase [Gammaproteobacteria bacterium CG22_combo_CG10-13_8_21_14_all_40_8]|nr:MAG: di-trans,poly-cis-decaprenylcistransferase [Gammaproteobacteria bacterium CG22_combo_CG10-13_8_21_14_all_40_8]
MINSKIQYPNHVAIVMDGNGRWAQAKNRPRVYGHQQGVECTRGIIEYSAKVGIKALTLFAFSSENWKRPEQEVSFLMQLFIKALSREAQKLHQNNVCLKVIGEVTDFEPELQRVITEVETLTAKNDGLKLFIAANYGGQWDITLAAKKIAQKVQSGNLRIEQIDADLFQQQLCLADVPAVDLFIRTGGEIRISNFLLWQIAYAELYFTKILWPDFNEEQFLLAIGHYAKRERRFGQITEQLSADPKNISQGQNIEC